MTTLWKKHFVHHHTFIIVTIINHIHVIINIFHRIVVQLAPISYLQDKTGGLHLIDTHTVNGYKQFIYFTTL